MLLRTPPAEVLSDMPYEIEGSACRCKEKESYLTAQEKMHYPGKKDGKALPKGRKNEKGDINDTGARKNRPAGHYTLNDPFGYVSASSGYS